jgi:hypothetical protein
MHIKIIQRTNVYHTNDSPSNNDKSSVATIYVGFTNPMPQFIIQMKSLRHTV